MMNIFRKTALFALSFVLVLGPLAAEAQVGPPRPGGMRQRQQLERQVQMRFQQMVKSQLEITDETMQGIQEVMQSFQEERRGLAQSQASVRHQLRDPALPNITDEAAGELLQEMVRLQERELELYRQEQERLLALLPPAKLLRFYALREEFGRRVMELRGGRGGGMGGPGEPGVGGNPGGGGFPVPFLR